MQVKQKQAQIESIEALARVSAECRVALGAIAVHYKPKLSWGS